MKNLLLRSTKQIINKVTRIIIFFVALGFFGSSAYSQITSTTPSSRCGEGTLVLHATASSGTITWYDVPFYGTEITEGISDGGTTFTTPFLAVTKTYYVDAVDENGCSINPDDARVTVIATISANSIQAIIFYVSNTFCKSIEGEQEVTRTGTAGGIYTADPAGLTLDASTGSITPSTSAEGTYMVTYTVFPAEGCVENPASTSVTITTAPVQPAISYAGSPYCTTNDPVTVIQTGASGGTYSASPSGLTIHSTSGTITPSSSLSGNYTITYFIPGAGGCDPMSASTSATILKLPTASISYSSPFTKNQGSQPVTLTGTGVYTGGVFSSTTGLTIDPSTGAITPSSSTAGTYTVTYTLAAVSPCAEVTAETEVTVYSLPTAIIDGDADVCKNSTPAPDITFTGAEGTAPYTFTYQVNAGFDQMVTTTSGNSVTVAQPTETPGTYVYSLVSVVDVNGSYQDQTGSATITVNIPLIALFSYLDSPYCSNASDPDPTFLDNGLAGIFSSTEGLVFVSTATGQIDLSASTPGTYTVTNTIAATDGCPLVSATADITITRLPITAFSYPSSPYCATAGTASPTITDAGIFTATDPFVIFIDDPPGTVNVAATPPGTYEITNTIIAADGCAEVHDHASITIQTTPAMTISHNYSICNGTSTNIELSSNPSATNYSWTIGSITGSITGASSGSSATIIDQVLSNPSNSVSGTVEYIIVPTLGTGDCSVGNDFYITVTVKPTPQLSSTLSPTAICSGATFTYTATSNASGATFAWTRETVSGITEPGITGTGDVSETLTNSTTAPIDVTYEYITTADECSNTVQNVVVSFVPDANITTEPLSPASICIGGTTENMTIAAADGTPSLTYQWQYYNVNTWEDVANGTPVGSSYTGATGTTFSVTGISTAGTYDYKCIVSASGNGCGDAISNTVTVTVVDDPSWENFSAPTPTSLCLGGTVAFSVDVADGLGGDITWIRSDESGGAGTTVTTGDEPTVGTWYYRPHFAPTGAGCDLADGTETTVTVYEQTSANAGAASDDADCNALTYVLGATPATVGQGTWTASPAASFSDENSPTATATVTTYEAYTFTWTVVNGTCSSNDNIVVTFWEQETSANAGVASDDADCNALTYVLGATPATVGQGTWTASPAASFSDENSPTATATVTTYEAYTFTWTVVNGTCSSNDNIVVTFWEQETSANAGVASDDADCNALTYVLGATPATVGQGTWTASPAASFSDENSPTATATVTTYEAYTFTWTVVNGTCSSNDNIVVTFWEQETSANAGVASDDADCNALTYVLGATPATVGQGTWTASPAASFSDENSPTATATVTTYEAYTFTWTVVNGTCSSNDNIVVTFWEQETSANAGAASDDADCNALTYVLGATPATVGLGTWTASPAASFSNENSPTATATVTTYEAYTFTWTVVNGTCSSNDNIVVTFWEQETSANAGAASDDADCNALTYVLGATPATVGLGTWTASPAASFSDENSPTATATVTTYEAYTFTWTVVNGTCSSNDNIVVTFWEQETSANAGAASDDADCNALTYVLGATPATVGQGTWTASPAASFSDENSPTATATVTTYEAYTFTWTVVNGTCSSNDNIVVTFWEQETSANAGAASDDADCNALTYVLGATPATVGQGTWTASPAASFSDENSPTATATVTTYEAYTFTWTVVNGTCSSNDNIVVTFWEQETSANAGAASDDADCNALTYVLGATPATVGQGTWTASPAASFSDENSPTATATVTTYEAYTFTWTVVNGTCSSNDNIVVTFIPTPSAPTATAAQSFCSGTSPTVADLTILTGTDPQWYADETGGTAKEATEALVTATSYWASQTVDGCESTARFEVTATVNTTPTPTFTAQPGATANCTTDVIYSTEGGKSNYVWTYSGTLNVDYIIISGGGDSNSVTLRWINTGDYTVTINYTENGCTAATATSSTTTTVTCPS